MSLKRLLQIFRRNERLTVITEGGEVLFSGTVWLIHDKYLLSCLVLDVYRGKFSINVVVAYD